MKKGDKVITMFGTGKIKSIEEYSRIPNRICVELVKNPFSFSPVCFFENEVKQNNEQVAQMEALKPS